MEIQRARHEQGEQYGKPVRPIEGQKPPVKFNIGKEFMADGGKKFAKEMQRDFMLQGAKKSGESVERVKKEIRGEIAKVNDLQEQHELLLGDQAAIHKGLHDIWRLQLLRQRENEERQKAFEESLKRKSKPDPKPKEEEKKEEEKKEEAKEEKKEEAKEEKKEEKKESIIKP